MTKEEKNKYMRDYYKIPRNIQKRKETYQKWKESNPNYYKTQKHKEKSRKSALDWYYNNTEKSKEKTRERKLNKVYGISLEIYQAISDAQKGLCAICGNKEKVRLSVDHNHKTGKVRGLLCRKCNTAIGLLNENLERLGNVIKYIKKHTI